MNKHQQIFEFLLTEYELASRHLSVRDEIAGLFIPTVGPGYFEATKKIFYIGRDSNGWDAGNLQDCIERNCVGEYIENTTEFLIDQGYLHYNKNRAFGFWSAVARLHLRIKGISEYVKVSTVMTEQQRDLLFDFGYGNTNSIEIPATLIKQGLWNNINQEQYQQLKSISRPIDKFVHIVNAFQPQLVFIFNWDCNKEAFLEGLRYDILPLSIIDNKCWHISFKDIGTQIIWTAHPGNMMYSGYTASAMVDEIYNYLTIQ